MSMEFNYDKEAEITGVKCSKEISILLEWYCRKEYKNCVRAYIYNTRKVSL